MSMNAALLTLLLLTSRDTHNVIFSPALPGGLSPRASQAGPTIVNSGPAPVRASRSAHPGNAKAKQTSVTSGPSSSDSSVADGPLSSWENRLRQRLALIGSTECLLTWKASVTPGGRSFSRLVPSMRPTVEIDSGSSQMEPAVWATIVASEVRQGLQDRSRGKKGSQESLTTTVAKTVAMSLWATPLANLSISASYAAALKEAARLHPQGRWTLNTQLAEMIDASSPSGAIINGLSDTTGKLGGLNPEFGCWLMGFLPEWDACAPTVTRSSRKSPPK